jgi:outer membrane immunogenic protein
MYGGVNTAFPLVPISKNTTGEGWTIGGGLEYALTNHWTVRTEYLYADLGKTTFTQSGFNVGVKTTENIVRAGLSYKFGGPEAPALVAKY